MTLKTGMLVGVVGTEDMGVLIQIRSSSNTCVIKLNNGTLKKNVPLEDVEEARDMSDTKENKSPIRLGGAADSPGKSPGKLASLSVDTKPSTDRLKPLALEVGDAVRARCNGGSRWFPGRILRVNRDGTYDVEYADGDIEKKVAAADVQVASKLDKTPLPRKSSSFDVGDKVKARYKKGTKLFSGEIARVRSDGTYDIRYDDGDSETRVAQEMIEFNTETRARTRDSDEEAPASTKTKSSSGFRVDQSVKARYKGGKKLFPGKIKRVHSDGTYDIRYEDGDEEKRVKAENIEATERDEERSPAKGASSSRSKALTVGKKVKARHKNGKRLYSGKISRVRSDGTYDIDYDDGEIETRVEASQIEVSDNEDDMFADSDDDKKKAASTKKKAAWEVGDRVKAYYGKGQRLFSGKIAKVYMNGTYDIKYDDGDSETRLEAIFIESAESDARDKDKSIKTEESSKPSSKPLTKRSLRVGDAVKAKYKRGTRFFPGKITRARMDGTFDVKYEDGDVEERVEVDFIQRVDDGEDRDEEEEKPKKTKQKPLEVGDIVKAPFQRGVQLFRGKISRVRSDGTYDIVFDNGDKDTHIPRDLIQSDEQDSPVEKPKKMTLKVGDAVKARYKNGKKLFAGTVTRARSDGTYDIKYDDGDVEMCVDIEMIEVPEGKTQDKNDREGSPKPKRSLKVGDKVRARYNKGSKMFSGEITAVHRDGTFDIRYEDGDKEKFVEAKDIEVQDEERESQAPKSSNTNTLKVGDTVEANYKNGVKFFPGRIARAHSDGTYDVTFEDGDSERRVPRSRIKSKADEGSSPKKKMGFAVGDAVKAKYKKGTKFFSGKIARVRSDGTYDVEYDDGDSETRVDASLIIGTESETSKASENSPKVSNKAKHFEVGDAIKARYKKGTKLFPGKITRVRSDGTYDVRYDDGDTEMYVESSFIQGEDKPKSREEADDKKSTGFAVGDKVNARYKGGMKAFPGRIVKVRMDGTYDVEYDDGDTEQRIQSSAIELVPGTKKPEAKASSKNDEIFGDSDSDVNSKKRSEMKGVAIKVGDVVEANFKQKGKFHRGKVVRARSDGTFDIDYDVGASERHVRLDDIKRFGDNQEKSEDSAHGAQKPKTKPTSNAHSSDSDRESSTKKKKNTKKSKKLSSSDSSGSDREKRAPLEKGSRVTYRNADDRKSRRVGTVRKVHYDGSYDVKYHDGDTSKRIAGKLLVACSDSEDSEDGLTGKRRRAQEGPIFRRQERVLSNWRRSSKLSKPRMTDNWSKATVLEINGDGTYSIRYSDGVVEEDVPSEALKAGKKDQDSGSDGSSGRRRKRKMRTNGISTESLFLLEQLALTLFEEGILKKKPAVQLLRSDGDSSSSESSSSSSTESGSGSSTPSSRNTIDKVLKRLFDSGSLQTYRQMFKENDVKSSGKISRSRIIALVEEFMTASKPVKGQGNHRNDDDTNSVGHILTEWFATHDDLRIHRHFEFKTLMLAFAYAKSRLGKLRMEQSVATVLEGRFASYHESKRQLELWQQKLGYRLFETLQRHFHEHALSTMIPSRIRVSDLSLIFEQVSRQAAPNKPLDVYLQQHHLFPHQTLLLPEFLCCYYQLYGSEHPSSSRWSGAVELRPIAFVASFGRTQAQVDLILRFREGFESLLSTESDSSNPHEEQLLETSQLAAFAAKVTSDPTRLEPAMTTIRKRSGAVSLVEIFGSCGFIIDEVASAPTIRNAIDKMKMRVELAEVRRIIGLVRNICVKILRFPNNADYWRIRADSAAFQQKIGRFDGAASLLEAVGFVEHLKTHYELRGARNSEGKRVSTLDKPILDTLREKCVQLDGELSLFDGVESISSILQRISQTREREGEHFSLDECHQVLTNLSSTMENVLKNPKDSRCWRIREANSTFQRQIGYLPFAEELMGSIGFDLVQTSHGNAYTLRGTGMTGGSSKAEKTAQPSASLSNFAFTSVSSQMEWFLWRRKQEIDGLLEDEMRYLHDIVGHFAHSQNAEGPVMTSKTDTNEAVVKMYPYGTNAIETFNKTSIQRKQLEMMRNVFKTLDVDQKGVLNEADFSRAYGSSSSLPTWARFEAFDIGNDGKVDLTDFVAALGPLLDHPYEVRGDKSGDLVASSSADEVNSTLCEVVSLSVGNLRLETSCASAAVALEGLLTHLFSIIQEPGNPLLWSISDKVPTTSKLLRFSAGRAAEATYQPTASRISGLTMVLAESASSGADVIVVQKGQFVLRGAYVRVGAEIRDLYEERMVVDVSSNEEHAPGFTKLRLGVPLRFFHPAKELVATILLPSMELVKRLETSDTQTFAREIVRALIKNVVESAPTTIESGDLEAEKEPKRSKLVTTLVTSFEVMNTLPDLSSNLEVGPSMRYLVTWSAPGVSVVSDHLSDRKLVAYWEGLVLQAGTSNKTVRLADVKMICRWNGHLSLLLSTAANEPSTREMSSTKSDGFQMTYKNFREFFRLPPSLTSDEEERDDRLELPLAYLRKHFQALAQTTELRVDGFQSVQAFDLLHHVYKDVQEHPPVVSEDPQSTQEGLETIQDACQKVEQTFVDRQRSGRISWPQLVYFVRYNKRLTTPDIFPSAKPQIVVKAGDDRKVAEVVSGMHSSRVLILQPFDIFCICLLLQNAAAQVFFSTKTKAGEESSKTFIESWMEASQTTESEDTHAKRAAARINQFKRSSGTCGALIRFCGWDSVVCVNSSNLQESGSGSFRFFRMADSFLSPIRQVNVEQLKVDVTRSDNTEKKVGTASSSGVIRTFQVTVDGSKVVFLTGSDTVVWVACAGTGAILCHADLQASQVGKFRVFFQVIDKTLPSGEIQTQLYATTSAKSYRHAGMWVLPEISEEMKKPFERNKVFSFGKSKAATVVGLAVSADLLFIASRDGAIIVWSTATDQISPIAPLICLQIPLHHQELQSIYCQPFGHESIELGTNVIQVGDTAAADIDRWEVDVLQHLDSAPLRFALYLFDDGDTIRLPVPGSFDVRLVTLDDPAFEYDVFLTPVSGIEHNAAMRVTLQKQRIIRVLFIALRHSRDGIFAQKSVQTFFQDFENYGVQWKTRDEMKTFASSYQENVRVELQAFYRYGDNEFTELTKPQSSNSNESTKDAHPVLAVGVALKSRVGDQATFQAWKFAMNWCTDEIRSEIDPEDGQLSHTRRVLALQSSYRLEAERMARIRRDFSLEEHVEVMETRHSAMVRGIKDGVRDSIAHNGRPEVVADNLLKAVNVLALASFSARVGVDPLEAFVSRIYRQCIVKIGDEESVELSRANLRLFIKLMQLQEDRNVCFAAWLKRFHQELVSAEKLPVSRSKNSVWSWLSLKLRHIAASTQTTADVGSLLVGLGLADAFNCSRDSKCGSDSGFPSASSLPSLMLQLHRTVNSTRGETLAKLPLESTMETLLTPRTVVEFMVECTNFAAFFHAKMTDLQSQVQGLLDNESHQMAPEASYVLQLQTRRWQQELRELAQSHNQLNCDGFGSEDIGLEATVEDRQHLERLLKTPLPANHPRVSSITLEDRCDTIRSRDRFVMNAIGRLTGAGVEFVSLSVLYVFMGTEEHAEQEFQQELTFLRKVQHLRAREYFLPVFLDILDVPILPAANAMICASDTDEVRCVVTDSLRGWRSLTECIQLMRLSPFPMEYWTPLLWCWSLRVLMALLTMQKERFALRKGLDMDTMLVSPDGCDLRLSSVAGGGFVRFGERGEDANSLEKTFGCFVYALLLYVFSDEGVTADLDVNISLVVEADDEVMLRKMRSQLIRLMASKSVDSTCGDERNRIAALTDFSSITQIVACRAGKREGGELGTLCELSLLALQPSDSRPGLESLWVYAGRPGIAEESPQLKTLSLRMVTIVKLQRPMQKLLRDVRVCWEECDDRVGNVSTLQCAIESWTALLHQIFQLKPNRDDKKDAPTAQIFVHTLTQTLESCVPYQLCAIAMRTFTQCSKRGDREEGRQAIQILLGRFANVLELVETTTNFDELSSNSLLMRTVQQVLECLVSVASGQMPPRHLSADIPSLSSRFQRDTAANAVLWRLSERCFKDLLAIETTSSKYPALLQWLSSRRASFGFASALCVDYEGASGAFDTNKPTLNRQLALWWSGHTPRTPRHTLSSAAEDEMVKDGCTVKDPMTADQLRCVYETKEIEFKLTSGVSVPKFRLAALQQFFGPTFFERKRCFPLVFVRPLVAKVWRDLAFDRLICTLLRDRDEKIVLGALSLLECSTRVFRFDVLRSPRLATSKEAAESTGSLAYSCSEWTFAVSLCSQSVALEVKRVLDRTTRSLKVLGESGTSSASRSQHPLVAILCVGIAWLVNCLYGGDSTTQFWGTVGIDQFLVAHCKANSLPFVKIKDSNMMNQVFHQGQRLPQQDSTKWRVFTSEAAENRSHRSSAGRNCSPFRLLLDEIILVGSNRAVGLMRTLLLSRTFREEAGGLDISSPESAFQRDLLSSGDFGNVSHAIDLARDITQLNGTTNEQIQLVLYTNAVFLLQTATAARFRLSVFAPVCREIWGWMETTWRTIAVHSSSKAGGTDEKAVKLARAQGDVLVAGFSLLHSIVTRPSVTIEDIAELTTFDAGEDAEMVNVLHEIFSWIINMPGGVSRRRGSPVSVVVEGAVKLLTNSVQSRRYDEVALAMVNTCVDTRILLEMLGVDDAVESEEGKTIVSIDEKQQLWAMLLYFDNRTVTSRILDLDFLDSAVFSRLIGLRTTANSDEDELNILNPRLEAALLLEILVLAASRRGKSVNTRMLFAEACKLVLHHDIVAKEARYVRKVHDSSGKSRKRVAASKRVMQLVCCLCVDFSSQSASRVFLEHLESVGIPAWVVAFHQAQHGAVSNEQQLVTRVELFWEDWQGHSAAGTRSVNHNVVLEPSRKTKTEKIVVQTARRLQRSASQATERPPSRVKAVGRVEAEVLDSEVSVKEADSKPELAKPRQTAARTSTATKKEPSVLHTLVSIDADSALRLVRKTSTAPGKRNRKQQRESMEDEDALDSDAYSPFPDGSSTEEEPPRAARKAKTRKNSSQEQKVTTRRESEDKENKFQGDSSQTRGSDDGSSDASSSVSSRERPRRKPQRPKVAANQQLDALRAIFRKYDVDGDGFISFIDLRRAMDEQTAGQGHRLSDLEIQRWITDKDRGGQGVVSFEDFADAFKGQLQK
ncbi:hypothetical protein PF011_g2701 [Phytophthora fragariae]|uniref:Uncharacterized protein n=1 Tax=Phytophthora fragariae TaxID=53985 RepID=A0A6A3M6Z1_9STRA|nr:hypothetical protein PF011_g2701 [Phytophthora fragariae]